MATYGQIADLAGLPRQPRQVGYALAALRPGNDVPWHRVINAKGEISLRADPSAGELQRVLLEAEGVEFDERARVSFTRYGWRKSKGR